MEYNIRPIYYIKYSKIQLIMFCRNFLPYSGIKFIRRHTLKNCKLMINKEPFSIEFFRTQCMYISMRTIKFNGVCIRYIRNPSNLMSTIAVKTNAMAIRYVKQTEKKCILSIINNPWSIEYIRKPSYAMCVAALSKSINVYYFIDKNILQQIAKDSSFERRELLQQIINEYYF